VSIKEQKINKFEALVRWNHEGEWISPEEFIPIDYIKIDQSFIRDMSSNKDDNVLVSTIIAMSKSLEKEVVAEGVETKEQLQQLIELDCDLIQGFYFSKPLPSESLVSYLLN